MKRSSLKDELALEQSLESLHKALIEAFPGYEDRIKSLLAALRREIDTLKGDSNTAIDEIALPVITLANHGVASMTLPKDFDAFIDQS